VPIGSTEQLKATAVYSDGGKIDVTLSVNWSSSDPTTVNVGDSVGGPDSSGPMKGAVKGIAAGDSDITCEMSGKTSSPFVVTVPAASASPSVSTPAEVVTVDADFYDITGTATAGAEVRAYIDQNNDGSPEEQYDYWFTTADSGGNYTVTVPLARGNYNNFVVVAVETGQSISAYVDVPTIIENSTPLEVFIINPHNDWTYNNEAQPIVFNYYITPNPGVSATININGTPVELLDGATLPDELLALGENKIQIDATDDLGHSTSTVTYFIIDHSIPAMVTANHGSGIYNNDITVFLNSSEDASIYYTTNESTPDITSTPYTETGISITGNMVLKAIAYTPEGAASPVETFTYIIKKSAGDLNGPVSHAITLAPGWNIFSVPKVVASSNLATLSLGSGGGAYLLVKGQWVPYATAKAAFHPSVDFAPLYGYIVNNQSGGDLTLTVNYKETPTDLEKQFARDFATTGGIKSTGWYSIGVASPEKALTQGSTSSINVDTSDLIYRQQGSAITQIMDYTANANNSSVVFASTPINRIATGDYENQINPRETRGYVVFVSKEGSAISGNQR